MALVILAVVSCQSVVSPLPPGAQPFRPPAVYARWWAMTEACSGRTGDVSAVRWYRAPGATLTVDGEAVNGVWSSGSNRIVLAEEHVNDGGTVRHEMLHALLRVRGHPRAQFLGGCAGLEACGGICLTDAGPWRPPPDYVVLPPDSLEVDSRAELRPAEADGQRWLALEITVRNARGRAVVVAAPGDRVRPGTFSYFVQGPQGGISGSQIAADSSQLAWQPFETKRWLYEFRVDSALTETTVPPGTLLVRGGYARRWAGYDTVRVEP